MKNTLLKRLVKVLGVFLVVFWLPFCIIVINGADRIAADINKLPKSDVVIVFGTLVNESGDISPLLQERLDAGKAILQSGKAKKIVVSNTEKAAQSMADYLVTNGVDSEVIEIDTSAEVTTDTCRREIEVAKSTRSVIFVSQGFHLPRILYQCGKIGVSGHAFQAEKVGTVDHSVYSVMTKIQVRFVRYFREAWLTWLSLLQLYR